VKNWLPRVCCLGLLSACATSLPDHFYILSAQPAAPSEKSTAPGTAVSLRVSVPSLVDRPEMVFNSTTAGVVVMEHERWAAPFADLVAETLARDIERRRADLMVDERGDSVAHAAAFKMTVAVVQVSLSRGGRATIETQWRIVDAGTGKDAIGEDMFSAPVKGDNASAAAQALSECLGLLADRLAAQLTTN
jgi:uncharacterized lipoprotein YmbA